MPTQESLARTFGEILRYVGERFTVETIVDLSVKPRFLNLRTHLHTQLWRYSDETSVEKLMKI